MKTRWVIISDFEASDLEPHPGDARSVSRATSVPSTTVAHTASMSYAAVKVAHASIVVRALTSVETVIIAEAVVSAEM